MSITAVRHLRRADPVMRALISRVGRCEYGVRESGLTHFGALTRSIVYQQLSGRAAATIFGRLKALYGGRAPTPAELLATPDAALRAAGLSSQKSAYLRDLADRVDRGELDTRHLCRLRDEEVIETLTAVKGIGRWTAQMFLMFRLQRLDVLPDGDLGIRNAIRQAYGLRSLPPPERVRRIGAPWAPYRTIASWYLWRSLDVS